MSLATIMEKEKTRPAASQAHITSDGDWEMLDKSKFFFLGAALFSGVSAALYPIIVLKTRQQVSAARISCANMSLAIARLEGLRGFYKGFGTSLVGTIPARALYMAALEITKSGVGQTTAQLGFSDTTAAAVANGAAGFASAVAAQLVWTPIDVVSQRLMVQGDEALNKRTPSVINSCKYKNGIDAFRQILYSDGPRGIYRGFGISILTYAPLNAVWWASYSSAKRSIWCGLRRCEEESGSKGRMVVQATSATVASGCSALMTMPIDTIKTRLQVLDTEENGKRRAMTVAQTVRSLVKEGGMRAWYRGLGPRWVSMSLSATTMITTYEFLKRLSTKRED